MILKLSRIYLYSSVFEYHYLRKVSCSTLCRQPLYLSKLLGISDVNAEYLCIKYPVILKYSQEELVTFVDTVTNLGLSKIELTQEPLLFSIPIITLQNRYKLLQECGFHTINGYHLINCLKIIKQKSIGDLKATYMLPSINIVNRLASYMTQWPTSITTLIHSDVNKMSLYNLRLMIIQRYLELTLELSYIEFARGLKTYPTIKLKPLQFIHQNIVFLQNVIGMPTRKLKTNLYLIHSNTENLKQIVDNVKNIGGIDIKEVLRIYPKLCMTNWSNLMEIKEIMKEFSIANEAQIKCLNLFTLSPKTIRERIQKAKETPEFQVYISHPRFLKLILCNTNATKRVMYLYESNKKCLSLNSLSGCSEDFKKFVKAPGDRSGKGKDMLYCISQELGNNYSINDIRKKIKKHPFWINIPLVNIKLVKEKLLKKFSPEDIYDNCPILLYPLNKIIDSLKLIQSNNIKELTKLLPFFENIDLNKLNKSQELSIILYLLEKNHYFSGNGVWTDDKYKNKHIKVAEC